MTQIPRCLKREEVIGPEGFCCTESKPATKPVLNSEKTENDPSPETSGLSKPSTVLNGHSWSNGISTTTPFFSKKLKLTLKAESSSEGRLSLCLCKPLPLVHNSINSNCNDQNLKTAKFSDSSSEKLTGKTSEKFTALDRENEQSSLNSNSSSDSVVDLRSSSPCRRTQSSCICGICLKQFSSAFSLEKHRRQSKHYLCSGCGEAFHDSAMFEQHVEKKECKAFGCTICGQKFISDEELSSHESEDHFKCPECKKCFLNTGMKYKYFI